MIEPVKDNTIYAESGDLSNAKGFGLFAGSAGPRSNAVRRALLAFDVAASIPANATITAVEVRLTVTRTNVGAQTIALHRVSADWGEGTSNATGEEGMGATATTGDATWTARFFNTQLWTTAGGDFAATASATASAGAANTAATFASTPQLVADVQAWLSQPQTNFGWIVRGNEATAGTAKRFASREVALAASRPQLVVTFDTPPQTPTGTPSATPSSTPTSFPLTVSGVLRYYAGNQPPIAGVTVTASGSSTLSFVSNAAGAYTASPLSASNWMLTPRKGGDVQLAISALDATVILQFIADPDMFPLSTLQLLACDVTASGTCSALDATRILQYVAGSPTPFAAVTACGSDWLFNPNPSPVPNQAVSPPMLSNTMCQMGRISYMPLAGSTAGQDFSGLVIGDVTGNWMPGPP
ncbi:MAG: DNRLRE domain-containing protein [Candidatus Binatia bacterium]